MQPNEIIKWLEGHRVRNFELQLSDSGVWEVCAHEDVNLTSRYLTDIPVKFKTVAGHFSCAYNALTNLDFAPEFVGESFDCQFNQLTSLRGAPSTVNSSFMCHNNLLQTLEGAPARIKKDFICAHNQLKSLEYAPKVILGSLDASSNQIETLRYIPELVGSYVTMYYNNKLNDKVSLTMDFEHLKILSEKEKMEHLLAAAGKGLVHKL